MRGRIEWAAGKSGRKNYWRVTEDDFSKAEAGVTLNQAQQPGEVPRTRVNRKRLNEKTLEKPYSPGFLNPTSTPGGIRTPNPRFRRPMRYPIAPRAREL